MKKIFNMIILTILTLLMSTNVYATESWAGVCICSDKYNAETRYSCASKQQNCSTICSSLNQNVSADNCTKTDSSEVSGCGAFADIIMPIIKIFYIALAFILLVLGAIDFFGAVTSSDEKNMKKFTTNFFKRLLCYAALCLLPVIVNMIISWTAFGDLTSCFGK